MQTVLSALILWFALPLVKQKHSLSFSSSIVHVNAFSVLKNKNPHVLRSSCPLDRRGAANHRSAFSTFKKEQFNHIDSSLALFPPSGKKLLSRADHQTKRFMSDSETPVDDDDSGFTSIDADGDKLFISLDSDNSDAPVIDYSLPDIVPYTGAYFVELPRVVKEASYWKEKGEIEILDDEGFELLEDGKKINDGTRRTFVIDLTLGGFLPFPPAGLLPNQDDVRLELRVFEGYSVTLETFISYTKRFSRFIEDTIPLESRTFQGRPTTNRPYIIDSSLPFNLRETQNFYANDLSVKIIKVIKQVEQESRPINTTRRFSVMEILELSTSYGNYGAGRTINTFTLLPGEESVISLSTFKDSDEKLSESSTIFDSASEKASKNLEDSIQSEQTNSKQYETSKEAHAEVSGGYSGFGAHVSASAGGSISDSSARQSMAKNVMSAVAKHAKEASSKRDVTVNANSQTEERTGEKQSVTRTLKNINTSRTLNFVFRQMNQEYISVLHLIDFRVAIIGGGNGTVVAESITKLPNFVAEYIKPEYVDEVVTNIYKSLLLVLDKNEDLRDVLVRKKIDTSSSKIVTETATKGTIDQDDFSTTNEPDFYYVFDSRIRDSVRSESGALTGIKVPGIILAQESNVVRTEGVVVEAILGEGVALDNYGLALQQVDIAQQEVDVQTQVANNRMQNKKNAFLHLRNDFLANGIQDGSIKSEDLMKFFDNSLEDE